MIKGLASINGIGSVAENNIQSFEGIFEGLRYKLPVKITFDGKEVYSNIQSKDGKTKKNPRYFKKKLKNKPELLAPIILMALIHNKYETKAGPIPQYKTSNQPYCSFIIND